MNALITIYIKTEDKDIEFYTIMSDSDNADYKVAQKIMLLSECGVDLSKLYAASEDLKTTWDFESVSNGRVIVGREKESEARFEYLAHMAKEKPAETKKRKGAILYVVDAYDKDGQGAGCHYTCDKEECDETVKQYEAQGMETSVSLFGFNKEEAETALYDYASRRFGGK